MRLFARQASLANNVSVLKLQPDPNQQNNPLNTKDLAEKLRRVDLTLLNEGPILGQFVAQWPVTNYYIYEEC